MLYKLRNCIIFAWFAACSWRQFMKLNICSWWLSMQKPMHIQQICGDKWNLIVACKSFYHIDVSHRFSCRHIQTHKYSQVNYPTAKYFTWFPFSRLNCAKNIYKIAVFSLLRTNKIIWTDIYEMECKTAWFSSFDPVIIEWN